MHYIRTKFYKTNVKNPTGLAICDFCGCYVNGGKLQKYYNYAGAPMPNYSVPNKYMEGRGDLMGSGDIIWQGFMVCPRCVDVPNGQSSYREPTADPYTADGNRPAPSFAADAYQTYLTTNSDIPIEGGEDEGIGV